MAIDCGEIIFRLHRRCIRCNESTSDTPTCCAVIACKFENNAFAEVSDPVKNTPIHPKNGEKNGNSPPVPASANASVEDSQNSLR